MFDAYWLGLSEHCKTFRALFSGGFHPFFCRQHNSKAAQALYKTSLYYILALSILLIVDRKVLNRHELKDTEKLRIAIPQV